MESGWNVWVWLVGVVSRRWVWLVGVGGIMGVVSRRLMPVESIGVGVSIGIYIPILTPTPIDYLILLIPTPLVYVLFCSSIPTFCSLFKMFFVPVSVLFCN